MRDSQACISITLFQSPGTTFVFVSETAIGISFAGFKSCHTASLLQTTPGETSAEVQAKQAGSKKQQIAAEDAAEPVEVGEAVHVIASCQERSGGDARVCLSCPLSAAPKGSTVHLAHPAHSALEGESHLLTSKLARVCKAHHGKLLMPCQG